MRPFEAPEIEWTDSEIRILHPAFQAIGSLKSKHFEVRCSIDSSFPLYHVIRAAVTLCLPLAGGVPVHACGVTDSRVALVFGGRSGAGKSTLAQTSPLALLSDEFVILRRSKEGWLASASGFWGEGAVGRGEPPGEYPLRALFTLDKKLNFELEGLRKSDAMRALIAMVLVPPHPQLWPGVLELLANLTESVPIFRMGWALGDPPWDHLGAMLDDQLLV